MQSEATETWVSARRGDLQERSGKEASIAWIRRLVPQSELYMQWTKAGALIGIESVPKQGRGRVRRSPCCNSSTTRGSRVPRGLKMAGLSKPKKCRTMWRSSQSQTLEWEDGRGGSAKRLLVRPSKARISLDPSESHQHPSLRFMCSFSE